MWRILTLFLPLAVGVLRAQEYSFHIFGNNDGLNNLTIRQIYQDRTGFIWVSNDGDRFEAFGSAQGLPSTSSAAFGTLSTARQPIRTNSRSFQFLLPRLARSATQSQR